MVNSASEFQGQRYRVILQARTNSSRLPAKVLLPMGGLPLSVLAASRIARGGGDVVVATSVEPADDLLVTTLTDAGLTVFRGPLDDVKQRFLMATADLPDDAVCIRMTADNPVPDAAFIETCLSLFAQSGAQYIAYGNDGQWLPYGLSAEVFFVGALRNTPADDAYNREHVTPAIRTTHAPRVRPDFPGFDTDLGHLRCTVDTLEDYLRMAHVFGHVTNPVQVPFDHIVDQLAAAAPPPVSALVLGTVQLGLPYGVTKSAGLMPDADAHDILRIAQDMGCAAFDTARAYGQSEARIGAFLQTSKTPPPVITKLDPIEPEGMSVDQIAVAVDASLATSMQVLGCDQIDTLLLHRAAHLEAAGGAIWLALCAAQDAGRITRLGVSVQSPDELAHALSVLRVTHIQMPFNPLDWRWNGVIALLRLRPDVTVHLRSVFLQGLLVQPDAAIWPAIADVDGAQIIDTLQTLTQDLGRGSVMDLCINYCRAQTWVDGIVCGVDSGAQLQQLGEVFANPPLTWAEVAQVQNALPHVPETLLNPALWPAK